MGGQKRMIFRLMMCLIAVVVAPMGLAADAFVIGKETYSIEEIRKKNAAEFYDIEKKTFELIDRLARDAYLDYFFEKLAKAQKKSVVDAKDAYFNAEVHVSDAQIKRTVGQYKDNPQLKKMGEKERWDTVKMYLKNKERQVVTSRILSEGQRKKELVLSYPKPEKPHFDLPIASDDHVKGNKNAKVTIVEFSDFECPYCARATEQVNKVYAQFKDKVQLVYKHFPLSFHPNAHNASEYSCCAEEQGKFWEMHDKIFENQKKMTEPDLKGYAKGLGLDLGKIATCIKVGKCKAKIEKDKLLGEKIGVAGTPSFFINGKSAEYGVTPAAIEAALKQL